MQRPEQENDESEGCVGEAQVVAGALEEQAEEDAHDHAHIFVHAAKIEPSFTCFFLNLKCVFYICRHISVLVKYTPSTVYQPKFRGKL